MDKPVWNTLKRLKVETQYYALRWIMVLMCQEFDMPDAIRLWDTLLAEDGRFEFLNYLCAQAVLNVRECVVKGDFAEIMEGLQSTVENVEDVTTFIRDSFQLRKRYLQAMSREQV